MKRKSYKIPEQQISMFELEHPEMPVFDKSRCEARLINHETAARMVETYHYAHRVPGMLYCSIGLYYNCVLAGCLIYSPMFDNISCSVCGNNYGNAVLELSRLYVHDYLGRNAESWLIGQSFKILEKDYPSKSILISYADSEQNHLGIIYQATNWLYTGMGSGGVYEYILPDGQIVTRRGFSRFNPKTGKNDYTPTHEELVQKYGAKKLESKKSKKHRYVYFLGSKKQRKELRQALKWPILPYPKKETKDEKIL